MSIQAIAHVLEHSESRGFPRLVLLAIANHADAFGMNAYPSIGKIAQEARIHRATVYRSLEVLEEAGEIEITMTGGLRHYRVQGVAACDKVSQRATEKVSHAATDRRSVRKQASITQPLKPTRAHEDLVAPLVPAERERGKANVSRIREQLGLRPEVVVDVREA